MADKRILPSVPEKRLEPSPSEEAYSIGSPVERSVEPGGLIPAGGNRPEERPLAPERHQFSLKELLALMTIGAVGLSILGTIPGGYRAPLAAGLTGLVLLLGLIFISALKPERLIVHVAWWMLFFAYVVACAIAVLRGD